MKISDAIDRLKELLAKHGDVDVSYDCPHCGITTAPNRIEIGPPVATMKGSK